MLIENTLRKRQFIAYIHFKSQINKLYWDTEESTLKNRNTINQNHKQADW